MDLLDANENPEDRRMLPLDLRPDSIREYIGQKKIKEKLGLFVQAARKRQESLDHVLLSGPPGLGKTTLARIISYEMSSQLHVISGPNVEKKGDLAAIMTNLQPQDVLFVDEIHRLPKVIEEMLYSAMEDFKLDIIIGQGPAARTLRIDLPAFTLVGATTRSGLLSSPLRDRFGVQLRLDFYPPQELKEIIMRSAQLLKAEMTPDGAAEIARRSRGTPRIANRLLRRVRDFAQVHSAVIDQDLAHQALMLLEVDREGLDSLDIKFLTRLLGDFSGGPAGIESLAAAIGEERDTLEDVVEPFLVQAGFIQRTSRGRVATAKSYAHLGFSQSEGPPSQEPLLT